MVSHSHPTQVNTPRLNPSQTRRYSIYLPPAFHPSRPEEWKAELTYTKKDGLPALRRSPIQVLTGRGQSTNYVDQNQHANHCTTPP